MLLNKSGILIYTYICDYVSNGEKIIYTNVLQLSKFYFDIKGNKLCK